MLTVVAPAEQLTPDQELALSKRLAQWRRQPLSPTELAELLPKVSTLPLHSRSASAWAWQDLKLLS